MKKESLLEDWGVEIHRKSDCGVRGIIKLFPYSPYIRWCGREIAGAITSIDSVREVRYGRATEVKGRTEKGRGRRREAICDVQARECLTPHKPKGEWLSF